MITIVSVLLGILTAVLPHLLFYKMLTKHQGATRAKQIVNSFYKGEAVKIILTVLLMVLSFNLEHFFKNIIILPKLYLAAYLIATISQSFVWIIYRNKRLG
jgi:ATP synthase protein I